MPLPEAKKLDVAGQYYFGQGLVTPDPVDQH